MSHVLGCFVWSAGRARRGCTVGGLVDSGLFLEFLEDSIFSWPTARIEPHIPKRAGLAPDGFGGGEDGHLIGVGVKKGGSDLTH